MFGSIAAYLSAEISGAVKRNLTIFGLYGFAGLLVICSAGYALNALHSVLLFRYGAVAASLWVAGGLLVIAILAFVGAIMIKNRKRPARPMAATALVAAPVALKLMRSRINWKMGAVGAIVVVGTLLGRQLFKGGADESDI